MIEQKSNNLSDIFFEELLVVESFLIAGDRRVPNWPWFWSLGTLAVLTTAFLVGDIVWLRVLPTWAIYGLQLLAPTLGFAALAFHQLPKFRVWKSADIKQKRTQK
jgi:hypothetical protein